MKIAYLVLTHANPELTQRALQLLDTEGASFWLHVDAKAPLGPFLPMVHGGVKLTRERRSVYWGEISQTEAILVLMREALAVPEPPDYLVLMSGTDFPLRSGRYVRRFFEVNRGREFITMEKLPAPGMPLSRVTTRRFPSTQPVRRFLFRALAKAGLATRDYRAAFGGLEPYAGHTWWALSREACTYVLEYLSSHPELTAFCRDTHASDETLIQTVLANSPFMPQVRRHLVFEQWIPPSPHPETITDAHVADFESQDAVMPKDHNGQVELLFARKVAPGRADLIERLSAMVARKDARAAEPRLW